MSVAKIGQLIRQILRDAAGAVDATLGTTVVDRLSVGGDASPSAGQIKWATGLGAIAQIVGPSDANLRFDTGGAADIEFARNTSIRLKLQSDNLSPVSDGSVDLGRSAAGFRTGYFGTSIQNGDGSAAAPSYTFGSDTTTGIYTTGADDVSISGAGAIRAQFRGAASTIHTPLVMGSAAGQGFFQMPEQSSAPSGVANTARLYAIDNGAGKTQLVVIFGSGAAQVLATEP